MDIANNDNTSNDGFQQVVNKKRNNKKGGAGNKIPKGVPVAKGFQDGKEFNYQPKAPSFGPNGGSTRGVTSSKVGSSTRPNEGALLVNKDTSNDRLKDKDVVDTGVMKMSNISSPNPFAALGVDEDEDEDIENVYDEFANLDLNRTSGASTPVKLRLDNKTLFCSFVYADTYYVDRRARWNNLADHANLIRDKPWVLLGDFNASLNMEDHSCGGYEPNIAMREFKDCVHNMEVMNVNCIGFREVVDYGWNLNVDGCAMYRVVKRLKGLKSPFRKLLHNQGNLHNRVDLLQKELDEIQKAVDKGPHNADLREKHAHYLLAFKKASLDEERFLRQKSKIE
ncbi:sodium/hydrogen exchanger 6 [Tanacetum coccineum]|uniref:Sodium/hydrogen exchanger 6 n=1 Tax=Tanacetum coccineum TaxID=301880 RepID=A0ABQ5CBI0_9ASTR